MMCEMRDDKGILQNKQNIALEPSFLPAYAVDFERSSTKKICNLFYFLIYSVTKHFVKGER